MGHARVLSKLTDPDRINTLAKMIIEDGLSVRDIEKLVSENNTVKKNKKTVIVNPRFSIYESLMREKIGSKIKIKNKKIEIPFDSEKDLERIIEILGMGVDSE